MMKSAFKFFMFMVISLAITACAVEIGPSTNELKAALSQTLPGYIELDSFDIQASENYGNQVEPVFGSRFKASVIAIVELYKIDKKDKGVVFVRMVTNKGNQTIIFGKITSRLFQGAWKHHIDIDGTPIHTLGVPLNQVADGRIIIRGSDEEKKHYAAIEKTKSEVRRNIANADQLLIGTWRDRNGLLTYTADGTLHIKFDDGRESVRAWQRTGDRLFLVYKRRKDKNGKWESEIGRGGYKNKIVNIDRDKYTRVEGGYTIVAKRVK